MTRNIWELAWAKYISTVRQFCEKTNSYIIIESKMAKSRYVFSSHFFTFPLLVHLLLPTARLNGVSQSVSIEYKMVHGFSQAVCRN